MNWIVDWALERYGLFDRLLCSFGWFICGVAIMRGDWLTIAIFGSLSAYYELALWREARQSQFEDDPT